MSEGQIAEWNRMYALLCDYKEENGDCLVPQTKGNVSKLAKWVCKQRSEYKRKRERKPSSLSDEREALLDQIGFTWKILVVSWDERYQQLEKIGSCSGPAVLQADSSLYKWCSYQLESRKLWRKKEREYQRELSSWKKSGRRGDRPKWSKNQLIRHERWIEREELLDQLDFWNQFRNS